MGDNDILQVSPNGETQIIEAKKVEEKLKKKKQDSSISEKSNLPQISPSRCRRGGVKGPAKGRFSKDGFPLQAPETKPEVRKFEYLDKASSRTKIALKMGDNDVIEVNPETGKAEIIFAPRL